MDSLEVTSKMLHDIRNSLNTILGYSQILQEEDDFCEDQKKMAESMEKAALKIVALLSTKKEDTLNEDLSKEQLHTSSLPQENSKVGISSKIVIIDDKIENLSLFKNILLAHNYNIRTASSGAEGLEVIKSFHPELVLLDVVMPQMSGYDVLRELKKNRSTKDIPVIFLTAKDSAEDIVKGFEEGATDYIAKPFHPKELLARVNTHLQKAKLFANLKRLMEESFHELYTPLSIISSAMQMQEIEYQKTDYTRMSLAACKTLQNIYDDLYYSISYADKTREKEELDFTALVHERVQYFGLVAQSRSLEFRIEMPPKTVLFLNRQEMERVLDNLISNAIKYTKEKCHVSISASKKDDKWIFLICNATSKEIDLSRIFKKYDRQQEEIFGLGIGLELVQSICKKNDIAISAQKNGELFCIKMEIRQLR